MPFFCTKSGERLVAPGISTTAGGDVPPHTGSKEHDAAESAAVLTLSAKRASPTDPASEVTLKAAAEAARRTLAGCETFAAGPHKSAAQERTREPRAQRADAGRAPKREPRADADQDLESTPDDRPGSSDDADK